MTYKFGEENSRWSGRKFCIICGKELLGYLARRRKTCSLDCSIKSKTHIGKDHPRWKGEKKCAICGKEITGTPWKRMTKTCSKECSSVLRSNARSGNKNPRWIERHVFCKECGNEITGPTRLFRTFCSRKCMSLWQSKNLSKENSPLWKGGSAYGDYPIEFNYQFRLQIRRRDGFKCQICHKRQKGLDVHHIDENKKNNSPSNLVTLCRSCHRKVHWGKEVIPVSPIVSL